MGGDRSEGFGSKLDATLMAGWRWYVTEIGLVILRGSGA